MGIEEVLFGSQKHTEFGGSVSAGGAPEIADP